jgi:hypothetical protein
MENLRQTIIEEIEKICDKKRIMKRSLKILNTTIENMIDLTSEQNEVIKKIQQLNDYNKLKEDDIKQIRELVQQVKVVFISDDEIMKQLDTIYNVSNEHPMDGVHYDEDKKQYKIIIDDEIIYDTNVSHICETMKEIIIGKERVFGVQISNVNKKLIKYNGENIILFITDINNEQTVLFDIKHLIVLLNDVDNEHLRKVIGTTDIYDGCTYFELNEFGGYIVRNLINENITYEIVEKLNSKLSSTFKNDMTKILHDINQQMSDVSTKQIVLSNDDIIIKQIDSDAGYNYSKEKPMDGVCYEEDRKKYRITIDGKIIRKKNVTNACDIVKKNSLEKIRTLSSQIFQVCKKLLMYQNKYIISYWTTIDDELNPLFDIKHILKLIDVGERQIEKILKKMNDVKRFIYFEPNEYNGYITRELIDEKTMYQIVLDSRSEFSKSFKLDVSNILIELRKNGSVQFNKPVKTKSIVKSTLSDTVNTISVANGINTGIRLSDEKVRFVWYLIQNGKQILLNPYNNEHVLYFFITNIQHPNDFVICKIGYTSNIIGRCKQLESEYEGADFHLIGIKRIKNEQQEQVFHSLLKSRYTQLVYNDVEIRKIQKEEIYIFDKCLWDEFNTIVEEPLTSHVSDINQLIFNAHNIGLTNETIQTICETKKLECETKRLEMEIKKIQLEIELERLRKVN